MFESLSQRLQDVFKRLGGQARINAENIDDALKQVRMALLEADVHFKVVKDFLEKVKEKAIGADVARSLSPSQVLIKIVHDELITLMGGVGRRQLAWSNLPPTVILMVGLQGTGKTTTAAKLALRLKNESKRVLLMAGDLSRPAAVDQLVILAKSVGVDVISPDPGETVLGLAKRARDTAELKGYDVLIVDTAGRLAVDEALMSELKAVKAAVRPHEILLVVDAMQGQDAVPTAERFHAAVGLDGLVLSKLDGDARGGAALSVLAATGKPVKFIGVGERTDALEPFYPERLASRILGMGDVVSLVERVQANVDQEQVQALAKKAGKQGLDLQDFMEQLQQMSKLGSLKELAAMVPGMSGAQLPDQATDPKRLARSVAIIRSMTPKERRLPQTIHGERRKRIAKGSGVKVEEVNQLLRQFEQLKKMMKSMGKRGRHAPSGMPGMPGMPPFGRF